MARLQEADPRWIVQSRDDGRNVNAWHWEEKDMAGFAKKRLKEIYTDKVVHQTDDEKFVLTSLSSFSGDCDLHQRKGRKFFTCDITLKITFSAEIRDGDSKKTGTGIINIGDASPADDDWNTSVSIDDTSDKTARGKFDLLARVYGVSGAKKGVRELFEELQALVSESAAAVQAAISSATVSTPTGAQKPVTPTAGVAVAAVAPAAAAAAAPSPAPAAAAATTTSSIPTKTVSLEDTFSCKPIDLFSALLDPPRIAAYTQAPAKVERAVGGAFEMLAGSISGTFVELEEGSKIVMKWRMKDWPAGHTSLATITLAAVADGTRLSLKQTGVPSEEASRTEYGWRVQFFQRIKMVFGYGSYLSGGL